MLEIHKRLSMVRKTLFRASFYRFVDRDLSPGWLTQLPSTRSPAQVWMGWWVWNETDGLLAMQEDWQRTMVPIWRIWSSWLAAHLPWWRKYVWRMEDHITSRIEKASIVQIKGRPLEVLGEVCNHRLNYSWKYLGSKKSPGRPLPQLTGWCPEKQGEPGMSSRNFQEIE